MPGQNLKTNKEHPLVVKGREIEGTHHAKNGSIFLVEVGRDCFRYLFNGETWELLDKIKPEPGARPCRG